MRCAKCGGLIHLDEDCPECGIGYREMLEGISHEEMRRLFKKIDELEGECRCIDLEASLMACELENSSLILPASMDGDNMGFVQLPGPNNWMSSGNALMSSRHLQTHGSSSSPSLRAVPTDLS